MASTDKLLVPGWLNAVLKRLYGKFPSPYHQDKKLSLEDLVVERMAGQEEHTANFYLTSHQHLMDAVPRKEFSAHAAERIASRAVVRVLETTHDEWQKRMAGETTELNTSAVMWMRVPAASEIQKVWKHQPFSADDEELEEENSNSAEVRRGSHQMAKDPLDIMVRTEMRGLFPSRVAELAAAESQRNPRFAVCWHMARNTSCTNGQIDQTWRAREQKISLAQALCLFEFYFFDDDSVHWHNKSSLQDQTLSSSQRAAMLSGIYLGLLAPSREEWQEALATLDSIAIVWETLRHSGLLPKNAFEDLVSNHLGFNSGQAQRLKSVRGGSVPKIIADCLRPLEDEGFLEELTT